VDGGDGGAVAVKRVSIKGHSGGATSMRGALMEEDVREFRGVKYCFHGVDVSLCCGVMLLV
jgi:hypothetical protein